MALKAKTMQWTKLVLPRGLVPATMAGLMAAGVVLVGWSVGRTDRMLRDDSVQQVQLVADAVNANDLAILQDTNHDLRAILTRRLNSQLFAIQRSIPQCRRISLFGHTPDGALNCLASNVPPGSPGNGRPGRSLGSSLEVVLRVAETGEPSVDGPFGTGSDMKVSAIAPIRNPRTDAIMGVLVMDRAAHAWQKAERLPSPRH